jgi:hypothetical protein
MIMSVSGKESVRIIMHWALILALLLGQSIAQGHDHDADTKFAEICALCLYVQQSGNALPISTFGLPVKTSPICIPASQQQLFVVISVLPFQSRAPPLISL